MEFHIIIRLDMAETKQLIQFFTSISVVGVKPAIIIQKNNPIANITQMKNYLYY
jgi:hypothetical protein